MSDQPLMTSEEEFKLQEFCASEIFELAKETIRYYRRHRTNKYSNLTVQEGLEKCAIDLPVPANHIGEVTLACTKFYAS
jgi:hypothetical protein